MGTTPLTTPQMLFVCVTSCSFSEGTLVALASFSEGRLVDKLNSAALLSPVAYLTHMQTPLGIIAAKTFVGELVTMESIRGVNVPMYTTLRRTTVVFTMIVEYLLTRQKYTPPTFGSVALIVFGAFVAGARNLSFDVHGYSVVFLANITTALYLATINKIGEQLMHIARHAWIYMVEAS